MPTFTKYEDRRAWTHVVAAAVIDGAGRVLIAERPKHKAHGGLWEFPGGKREHGETPITALKREFREEVGLELEAGRPLIRVRFDYPERALILDVWRIHGYAGEAVPKEGQRLRWVLPQALFGYEFPAANQPVVAALNLPSVILSLREAEYAEPAVLERLADARRLGPCWVHLMSPETGTGHDAILVARVRELCLDGGLSLMVAGSVGEALRLRAQGVHLDECAMKQVQPGQMPAGLQVAATCHAPLGLEYAARLGLDFAVLAPVHATGPREVHSRNGVGWHRVRKWVRGAGLPVFAHGGLSPMDLQRAVDCGCQGVMLDASAANLWSSDALSEAQNLLGRPL